MLVSAEKNSPALRKGKQGEGIRILQQALIDLGFPMPKSIHLYGSPDGIYGNETVKTVRKFQIANRPLSRDGVVGKNTMRKLDSLLPNRGTPLAPLPAGSKIRLVYSVPVVLQGQNPICWVACAAMIMSFKQHRSVTVGEINNGFDPSNSSMSNPATSWSVFYTILNNLGFTSIGPRVSPGVDYLLGILRSHGPFILTHYTSTLAPSVRGVGTHAVVITGIDMTADKVFFNNPWGNRNAFVSVSTILESMERLWSQNIRSVAYIP